MGLLWQHSMHGGTITNHLKPPFLHSWNCGSTPVVYEPLIANTMGTVSFQHGSGGWGCGSSLAASASNRHACVALTKSRGLLPCRWTLRAGKLGLRVHNCTG